LTTHRNMARHRATQLAHRRSSSYADGMARTTIADPICIESFLGPSAVYRWEPLRADGLCGRPGTQVVHDPFDGSWSPKCSRCAKFYGSKATKPMTTDLDERIRRLQRKAGLI